PAPRAGTLRLARPAADGFARHDRGAELAARDLRRLGHHGAKGTVRDVAQLATWQDTHRSRHAAAAHARRHGARVEPSDAARARRAAAQQAWLQRLQRTGYWGTGVAAAAGLSRRLEAAGAAGIIGSLWSQGWGVQKIFTAYTDRAPVLDIACEDYGLLYRLAENKQGPVIEVTAESQALGEVPVFNVIGEIKGSQLPNEYVMLSAHFDP